MTDEPWRAELERANRILVGLCFTSGEVKEAFARALADVRAEERESISQMVDHREEAYRRTGESPRGADLLYELAAAICRGGRA